MPYTRVFITARELVSDSETTQLFVTPEEDTKCSMVSILMGQKPKNLLAIRLD